MAKKAPYAELEQELVELRRQAACQAQWEEAFKESEERFKAQYHSIPIPTATWQKQGNDFILIRLNRAAETLLRDRFPDCVGRTACDLFRDDPSMAGSFQRCFTSRMMLRQEMQYLPQDGGASRYFMVNQVVLPPDLVLMYLEDISERKAAQMHLQESHDRLEKEVARRTAELRRINTELEQDIVIRKTTEAALREKERELEQQARHLAEMNTALKILLEYREAEKKKMEKQILAHVKKLIFPYLDKLEKMSLTGDGKTYVSIIRSNLKDFISPFAQALSAQHLNLTPTEIQIADLIKQGVSSKEIAGMMSVSANAVAFHRANIRRKLAISGKKINLRTYLQTLSHSA